MNRKGFFTLVELLIVIAIIAILASMLLPALHKARSVAQKIKCTGNLKSLQAANLNYAFDNNDYAIADKYNYFGAASKQTWFNALVYGPGKYITLPSDRPQSAPASYNPTPKSILFCPAQKTLTLSNIPATNFGINRSLGQTYFNCKAAKRTVWAMDSARSLVKLNTLRTASAVGNFADCLAEQYSVSYDNSIGGDRPDCRHPNKTTNFSYFDGHCGSVKLNELYLKAVTGTGEYSPWYYGKLYN